jgi:hypothetical protein
MDENRTNFARAGFDAQVGALLDRVQEQASIVDSLMAMPLAGESDAPREWNTAVTRRLERRLADAMRVIIEGEPEKKSA